MKKIRFYFFSLLILSMNFLIYSCSIFGSDDREIIPGVEETYTGIYSQGIEDSIFNPCIDQEESWLIFSEDPVVFAKIRETEGNPVYLELIGTPSEKGEYQGFFVIYDHKFEIKEVVEAKSLEERRCL